MEPYDNPSWDFSNGGESESERKIPKIVDYLTCSAGRTHFARNNYEIKVWKWPRNKDTPIRQVELGNSKNLYYQTKDVLFFHCDEDSHHLVIGLIVNNRHIS